MVSQTQMKKELNTSSVWNVCIFQEKGKKQVSYKGKMYDVAVVTGIDFRTGLKCKMALARFRNGSCYVVAERKVYDNSNKLVRHDTPYMSW